MPGVPPISPALPVPFIDRFGMALPRLICSRKPLFGPDELELHIHRSEPVLNRRNFHLVTDLQSFKKYQVFTTGSLPPYPKPLST